MKTREEAVALIKKQMDDGPQTDISELVKKPSSFSVHNVPAKGCTHYGTLELRELMDFIYEGKPASEKEFVE